MSSNSFPKKWLQSSRGLPGSFMNENHHTMTHIWKEDNNRQKNTTIQNQSSSSPTNMSHDQQIQQHNDMDDLNLLGQEPQRSILGPHNDEYQCQQANFPDETDFSSRSKKYQHPPPITAMFPQDHLAGGLYKIDQDPPPHIHKNIDANKKNEYSREVTELGNDPDPATKAAFQSTQTKPVVLDTEPAKPSSVAASVDSNRAIKNQPLVSDPINENEDMEDYDDDADYYTTSELMPATYVDSFKASDDDLNFETPTNATPFGETTSKDAIATDTTPANTGNMDDNPSQKEKTAPLQASDMYHQQNKNITPSNDDAVNDIHTSDAVNTDKNPTDKVEINNQQQQESLSSLRGDNTIQNSLGGIGDKYKNQDPTKQSFAQNFSATSDQIPRQQSEPALSQTDNINSPNKHERNRRSSLTESIGKLFSRHHKSN